MGDSHTSSKFLVQYRDNITSRAGKFSLKTNDFYEIYTYIHGDGPYFYFVNDSIYTIEPGAVLLLRPGVLVGSCKKIQARYTRLVFKIPIYMMDFICKINPVCSELFCNSDVSILNLTGERKKDYYIRLYYVGLDTMEESLLRIENRVKRGGHNIDTDAVAKRFSKRFVDLLIVLPYCNEATFYDNDNGFVTVAKYKNGELQPIGSKSPMWLKELIEKMN